MKKMYFKSVKLFNEFVELCKQYRIKFDLPEKQKGVRFILIPDTVETDMFLLETGFAD